MDRSLIAYVRINDLATVKKIVNRGVNERVRDEALEYACDFGHLDIVEFLIKKGAKNVYDALEIATQNGHLDIVKFLVEEKGVGELDKNLIIATKYGHLDIVKFLVEEGAKLDGKEELREIFVNYNIDFDVIKFLIENNGINIHEYGETLLELASRRDRLDLVKLLVEKGVDVNSEKVLPGACFEGFLDIVEFLVENGADIREDALIQSLDGGNFNVAGYLIENGADIHSDEFLKWAVKKNDLDIIEFLVKKGVSVNDFLLKASQEGRPGVVKFLLEKGRIDPTKDMLKFIKLGNYQAVEALINPQTLKIKGILLEAIKRGHTRIAELLITRGVNVIDKASLLEAIKRNQTDIVKLLISRGADVKDKDILVEAVKRNQTEIVKLMVKYGANPRDKNVLPQATNPEIIAFLKNRIDLSHKYKVVNYCKNGDRDMVIGYWDYLTSIGKTAEYKDYDVNKKTADQICSDIKSLIETFEDEQDVYDDMVYNCLEKNERTAEEEKKCDEYYNKNQCRALLSGELYNSVILGELVTFTHDHIKYCYELKFLTELEPFLIPTTMQPFPFTQDEIREKYDELLSWKVVEQEEVRPDTIDTLFATLSANLSPGAMRIAGPSVFNNDRNKSLILQNINNTGGISLTDHELEIRNTVSFLRLLIRIAKTRNEHHDTRNMHIAYVIDQVAQI